MPSTREVYAYLKKKYPDHGRKLYLMRMSRLYAMYYKLKRGENSTKEVGQWNR